MRYSIGVFLFVSSQFILIFSGEDNSWLRPPSAESHTCYDWTVRNYDLRQQYTSHDAPTSDIETQGIKL